MSEFKFKTNIKCAGCLAKVTPHLEGVNGIADWEVDIVDPNKILTVDASTATEADVKAAVEAAGFTAEKLN
jgi:copper chaperone CopZ